VYRQSIGQLAHVQETTNGMEPNRSAVLASRKNGDSTGDWTGIPGIIQYRRISPPDPQVFAGLPLLVEFALATLKIALNAWNSTFLLPLINGI
jgi:hypothetical protein